MKALLIVHDVYQDDNEFPLGVSYLASSLKNHGWDVTVYCMDIFHYSLKDLAEYLKKNIFEIIGIGFLAARFTETIIPLCKVINKYKKNGKLILGGHGPSPIPDYVLSKTGADAIVIGEAERIIHNVYEQVSNGRNILCGNSYRNIDEIPLPCWDLFPMDKYTNSMMYPKQHKSEKSLSMLTSRGCVNSCSFCYRMEKGLRLRSLDNVITEIKTLNDKYGVTYFEFADECFMIGKKRLESFCQKLEERNLKIKYWCATRVKGIDEETLTLLKNSGCKFINYGFESMDAEVLQHMNKNTTPMDNEQTAKLTKEMGILFGLNFIWGLPNDTIKTLKENIEFIKKYNTYGQLRTIRPVTPYPGSSLFNEAIEQGLLEDVDDFFNRFKNSDLITVNFTSLNIKVMYKYLMKANEELINDHQKHTDMSIKECENIIKNFRMLYYDGYTKFRGARHLEKNRQPEINPEGFQFGELNLPRCSFCKSSDIVSDDWKIWCNSCGKVLDDLED